MVKKRVTVIECTKSTAIISRSCDNVAVVECGCPGDDDYEDLALCSEAFGPILAIVELSNNSSPSEDFLASVAVPFLNNKKNIFGSLSCTIISPRSLDEDKVSLALESLEYGTIAINTPSLLGFLAQSLGGVWHAHPSSPGRQSGAGHVGNQFRVSLPAKSVVYGPSLVTTPIFDSAKPPPDILIDALTTMKCSHSTFAGTMRIFKLICVSFLGALFSYFLPIEKIQSV